MGLKRSFVLSCTALILGSAGCTTTPTPTMGEARVRQLQHDLRRKQDELASLKERNLILEQKVVSLRIAASQSQASQIAPAKQAITRAPIAQLAKKLPAYVPKFSQLAQQSQAVPQAQENPSVAKSALPLAPHNVESAIDDRLAAEISAKSGGAATAQVTASTPSAAPLVTAPITPPNTSLAPPTAAFDTLLPGENLPSTDADQTGEQRLYSKVLEIYREHRLAEMQKSVSLLLKTYPESIYADNALYLAGLLAFENGDVDRAGYYMERVLREYPHGNKAVSALFAKAMVEKQRGKSSEARSILQSVRKFYPGSPEAARAVLETKLIDVAAGKRRES